MVCVDMFSKRVVAIPVWEAAPSEVTAEQFYRAWVCQRGTPAVIVSDRDIRFDIPLSIHRFYDGLPRPGQRTWKDEGWTEQPTSLGYSTARRLESKRFWHTGCFARSCNT